MIETKQLVRKIRYKLGDNDEVAYSDYDILYAINEALRYIGQSQALMNSDFLEKVIKLDEIEMFEHTGVKLSFCFDGVKLPSDYSTLISVNSVYDRKLKPVSTSKIPKETEYKIVGNKIYAGVPTFILAYKYSLKDIESFDDFIDLPSFCFDFVSKIATMVLKQAEDDILMQAVENNARSIIPRRRYAGAEMPMPFYV